MDKYLQELIIDKNTKAWEFADVLLNCNNKTIRIVIEIIDNEIGETFNDEDLDIFDWMTDESRNERMLNSLEFKQNWWIIHKKLRRMIIKREYDKRILKIEKCKEKKIDESDGWNSIEPALQDRLYNKSTDDRLAIARAMTESLNPHFTDLSKHPAVQHIVNRHYAK